MHFDEVVKKMEEKSRKFNSVARARMEEAEEWIKIASQVPYLSFPSHWRVKIIPPVVMAVVRFKVRTDKMPEGEEVSIYLDWHDRLGFVGEPYWEVYPVNGDTERFLLKETDSLLECIGRAVKELEK